jgi:hypothetical protein
MNIFIQNEQNKINDNIKKMAEKIISIVDKSRMIRFINNRLNSNYNDADFVNVNNIIKILRSLSIPDLIFINGGENMGLFNRVDKPHINKKDIEEYISCKKLELEYSICNGSTISSNGANNIYEMHSIGKVFTGFLAIILLDAEIITPNDINKPLQLDKLVLSKLPQIIIDRLSETTMLEVMTHYAGLTNYLGNYIEALQKNNDESPIEPEDFIKYINPTVEEAHKFRYSNTSLLLVGLSIKHLYNKRTRKNKSYNEILTEYLIKPAKINTFSITKPPNAIFNKAGKDVAEFLNGSPAGGYWISPIDLANFGSFMTHTAHDNQRIKEYIEKYGKEFYYDNEITHSGGINGSNCWITVYLEHNISIAIMDNDGQSSKQLKMAIDYFS